MNAALLSDAALATARADRAIDVRRALEHSYRHAMSDLLTNQDVREQMGRRELYRRYARVADALVRVAERVWYAIVKSE
jgi:hypothetical protein